MRLLSRQRAQVFFLQNGPKDLSRPGVHALRAYENSSRERNSLLSSVGSRPRHTGKECSSTKGRSVPGPGHPSKLKPPIPPRDLGIMGPPDTKTGPPLGAHPILGCHPSSPKIPYTGLCLNAPPRSPTPAGTFSITVESFSLSTRQRA